MDGKILFDRPAELRHKFDRHQRQWVQIKALTNYSQASSRFAHTVFLRLLRMCIDRKFLAPEEDRFLNHLVSRYNLDWLTWAHKTRWVKGQIALMQQRPKRRTMTTNARQMHLFEMPPLAHPAKVRRRAAVA